MIVARNFMRSWETPTERGYLGVPVSPSMMFLVVSNMERPRAKDSYQMRILGQDGAVLIFTHKAYKFHLNWTIVGHVDQRPTLPE